MQPSIEEIDNTKSNGAKNTQCISEKQLTTHLEGCNSRSGRNTHQTTKTSERELGQPQLCKTQPTTDNSQKADDVRQGRTQVR